MACVAVIPARRAARTLQATLEALRLGNGAFVERVLVVTSSSDPTAELVRRWARHDPGVVLVEDAADRPAGSARNDGREAARALGATHLLFVDADCRIGPGGALALFEEMQARELAAISARVLGGPGLVARVRHALEFKEAASRREPPSTWLPPSTTMLVRAEAFDRVGGFPAIWPGEDLVFSQSLLDAGLAVRRSREASVHHDHPHGIRRMLAHQVRLGSTAAMARRLRRMPGSRMARSPLLAPMLLPARALRLVAWQAREGAAALAWTLAASPLLLAGLAAWTAGFVAAVRAGRRRDAWSPGAPLAATLQVEASR